MKKKQDVRNIYEAALTAFARYGYKRTRVQDVAEALGITKGALYLYVKDKKSLYEETVAYGLRKWQDKVGRVAGKEKDPVRRFKILGIRAYDYLARDQDLRAVLIADPSIFPLSSAEDRFAEINRASMAMLREVLEDGIRAGRFRPVDLDRTVSFLFSVYVMFVIKTYIRAEAGSPRRMFEEGLDLILRGLLRPEGGT